MQKKRKRTLTGFILLFSFLALSFVGTFHHHDDAAPHPECSICITVHQPIAASHPTLLQGPSINTQPFHAVKPQAPVSPGETPHILVRGPPSAFA
jgi:hypothetical protein